MYKIPLFDINFDNKEKEAVNETLDSKWISTGPKCQEFEKLFNEELGSNFSLTTSSCTSSLHMSLIALDIKENDEVLVPSLTFAATANVIKYVGATPVFCDVVSIDNTTIDPSDIKKKITDKTKAIIVMHYAGFPCDMDEIMSIAKKNNLVVIEDAAHAPLSEYKGRKLGTIGHIGNFSFFSNKNISIGEGGMITTNSEDLYKKIKLIRSHGMTTMSYERFKGHSTKYDILSLGYNYRMDDIRASIGIVQMKKLNTDLAKRIKLRNLYVEKLKAHPKIEIPFQNNKEFVSNYIFTIVLNDLNTLNRDFIRDKLGEKGIQTSIHYPPIHRFSIYKKHYTKLPVTDYVSNNLITLPMYSNLKEEDIDYVVKNLTEIIQ
ncbi:MAG: aminotransferase DegT [Pelagibacterales bacterium]|nr:aminotransferase DegT [Pelagibacterales bacterium]|tara:strand:+ start:4165 stop:5292 length:1128 start_codon:yes stop_codon:yes gene_type:complete